MVNQLRMNNILILSTIREYQNLYGIGLLVWLYDGFKIKACGEMKNLFIRFRSIPIVQRGNSVTKLVGKQSIPIRGAEPTKPEQQKLSPQPITAGPIDFGLVGIVFYLAPQRKIQNIDSIVFYLAPKRKIPNIGSIRLFAFYLKLGYQLICTSTVSALQENAYSHIIISDKIHLIKLYQIINFNKSPLSFAFCQTARQC